MAALTVQEAAAAGLAPSYVAASAGGDTFRNDYGDVFLHVKNGGGAPITVTFTTPYTVRGLTVEDPSGSVAAGGEKFFGPFDPALFNAAAGTGVAVGYSGVTTVTVAAIRVPRYT